MIREIQSKDKEQWENLYRGYADFYKVEMNKKNSPGRMELVAR